MIDRETKEKYDLLISELKDFAKENDLVFEKSFLIQPTEVVHVYIQLYFQKDDKCYTKYITYDAIKAIESIKAYIKYIKFEVLEKFNLSLEKQSKEEQMMLTYKKPEVYEHKNGYAARLYGKSSMSVYFDGKEVLHTGSRNVNTEDEVMELLAGMPEFFNRIF